MKSIKNVVSALERRRWSSGTRFDSDYSDYETQKQEEDKKYIVYYDEIKPGSKVPTTAAFTNKPFDAFEDAWKEAKLFAFKKYGQVSQGEFQSDIDRLEKEIEQLTKDKSDPKVLNSKKIQLTKLKNKSRVNAKYLLKQNMTDPKNPYILVVGNLPKVKGYQMKIYIKFDNYYFARGTGPTKRIEYTAISFIPNQENSYVKLGTFSSYEKAVEKIQKQALSELNIAKSTALFMFGKEPFKNSFVSGLDISKMKEVPSVPIFAINGFETDPKFNLRAKIKNLPKVNQDLIDATEEKMTVK